MTSLSYLDPHALRTVDSVPVRGTTLADLDMDRVRKHVQQAHTNGYDVPNDPLAYLLHKRCIAEEEGEHLATLAGLLCFGAHPQTLFPRAVIDLGHYNGVDPVSFDVVHLEKDVGGTVFDQIARVETYLWSNTHHGMTLREGSSQRVPLHEYPRAVIRELIVNMLAHRDYLNFQSSARVQKFRDRIEWISPGPLPPGITVENILSEQASRNPVLLSVLYEAGYGEGVGQGLNTVVRTLEQEGLQPPHFYDTGASFIVTVRGRPLDHFANDTGYARLSDRQRRIMEHLRAVGSASRRDLETSLNETARTIQRDLRELIDARLINDNGQKGRAVRYSLRDTSA